MTWEYGVHFKMPPSVPLLSGEWLRLPFYRGSQYIAYQDDTCDQVIVKELKFDIGLYKLIILEAIICTKYYVQFPFHLIILKHIQLHI